MEHETAIDKALGVLFFLHDSAPAGVSTIGRALGLPKSSAHRLLGALGRRGLVERDEQGNYRTGIALLALGLGALEREPLATAARPVLEAHAHALGETFFLVAARAKRLVVLDKAEGTGFLRAAPPVGGVVPLHATATGKLYLAFAPEQVAAPAAALERYTLSTPDARSLERAVARARKHGYATNHEEWTAGLSVLAAPVFARGRMLGVIASALATPRLAAIGEARVAEHVTAAAREVAARLSGAQGAPAWMGGAR